MHICAKCDESGAARREAERSLDSSLGWRSGLARDSRPSKDVDARFEMLLRVHTIL